jgi:hypothetical protein
MFNPARSKAEQKFAAAQKKYKQAANEKEKARQKELEHTANLRALRLAKEAADREAAEAGDTAAKK